MGLFSKKQIEIGEPFYIDMRIAEEQLPQEVTDHLKKQMWFMGYPESLSQWAIDTFGMSNDPNHRVIPQERDPAEVEKGKIIHPIHIPTELMDALIGRGDPENLILQFENWERTGCSLMEGWGGFLGFLMDKEGVTEKDFHALIVPDYTGESGIPGHDFYWYVILHPDQHNGLDYFVFARAPMLGQAQLGGYELAVAQTLELFNSGKAIPGLIKARRSSEGVHTRYYLPYEVVEATGWWVEEDEGIPSSIPKKAN